MRNKLLIIGALLVGVILILVFGLGQKSTKPKQVFDKTFNVSSTSYKPYDNKFFYDKTKKLATNGFEERKTSFENVDYYDESTTTYMVVSPYFYPTGEAIHQIKNFATAGNTVFICAYSFSPELVDSLYFSTRSDEAFIHFPPNLTENPWRINWKSADSTASFRYPGHQPNVGVLDSIYLKNNDVITQIDTLVVDNYRQIQLLEMTCGEGKILLCNNPILVSNYFLLHKTNYQFFNKIAQKLDLTNNFVVWDDYYRTIRSGDANQSNDQPPSAGESAVMKVIMQNQALRWAFYTFIFGIALFVLVYYRRIQKEIPIYASLKNNSEAYINVVSGLYWDQQNHKSIADKIINQFFDYLSSNFHINSKDFQENELEKISQKTGRNLQLTKGIFKEISFVKSAEAINKQNLMNLYQKINLFYQD